MAADLSGLSPEALASIEEMLRAGRKIRAIKRVRRELDLSLKDAKEAVEAHMRTLGIEDARSVSSGCLVIPFILGVGLLLGLAVV